MIKRLVREVYLLNNINLIDNNLNTKLLFLLQSVRNILLYLFIYSVIREYISNPHSLIWKEFWDVHMYSFILFFFIGTYASQKIYKLTGKYRYFVHFKSDIIITIIITVLLETAIYII